MLLNSMNYITQSKSPHSPEATAVIKCFLGIPDDLRNANDVVSGKGDSIQNCVYMISAVGVPTHLKGEDFITICWDVLGIELERFGENTVKIERRK